MGKKQTRDTNCHISPKSVSYGINSFFGRDDFWEVGEILESYKELNQGLESGIH